MALPITPTAADFDHPIEMLTACHERIKDRCETLRRLAAHLPVHGCDAAAQQAASNVMRYFDSAGRHHREDEEEDLFPALRAAAQGENAARIALVAGQLEHEHREIETLWLQLRGALENIAHGERTRLDAAQADRFYAMYDAHMAMEEERLFPLAEVLLGPEHLTRLGRSMAGRRGVKL